ncbi:hypothetical protein F0919_07375 [Taibaiella lutea]|uniref:Outer membrane protein beta-barrel domain-containing protein n=1 Tax=Taibaiella lutea TaxID=2608001 RepID=A0A5M6CGT6_9BACT|nr:hypothetical protein [Taibaiella lutea]KAA5534438.1 hypothetical protein F0919_07375 [Taibaiella lutea]
MKNKLLFLSALFVLFFGKAMGQSDTTYTQDIEDDETEEVYNDYSTSTTKLDTPIFNIGLYALSMPFNQQQAFGGGISLKMNYRTNRAVGLHLDVLGRGIDEDYGYIVGDPTLLHWNVGAFYEYTFLQEHNFQASFRMNAGVSGFSLKDNSIREVYTWYDEYGNAYEGERAVTVDENIFLRIAPAINLDYKISNSVALEGMTSYDFYVGNPSFGKIAQFNNYMIGLGVVIRINTKE